MFFQRPTPARNFIQWVADDFKIYRLIFDFLPMFFQLSELHSSIDQLAELLSSIENIIIRYLHIVAWQFIIIATVSIPHPTDVGDGRLQALSYSWFPDRV